MKNNRVLYLLIIVLTVWCVALTIMFSNIDITPTKTINEININGISTDFTKIVDEKKDSLVTVNAGGNIGSGFAYKQNDNDIYILTAYHTIADATSYYVTFANGINSNASLAGKNIYADLAVLKVSSPYSIETLDLADTTLTKSGEFVICIGTPISNDYDQSVELGMVSNEFRTIENSITVVDKNINYYLDTVQLSSNLKSGYSGSPIINMNGEVIGMITMSLQDGYNFAITANEIKIIADKIINEQDIVKYQLGIKGSYISKMPMFERSNLNLTIETISGLYIERLLDNSIALNAGVKAGDVLLSINGVELNDINDYLKVVYTQTDSFEFKVLRNDQNMIFKVDLDD